MIPTAILKVPISAYLLNLIALCSILYLHIIRIKSFVSIYYVCVFRPDNRDFKFSSIFFSFFLYCCCIVFIFRRDPRPKRYLRSLGSRLLISVRRSFFFFFQDTCGKHGETDRQSDGIGSESFDARTGRGRTAVQKW